MLFVLFIPRGVTILSEVEKDEEIKESDEEAMQTNVEVYLPEELGKCF
mgnify:CR=1 FL=1